ncbi:hypothetical protein ACFVUY_27080 [Kitasatospora sp. NPDC058063]|uniref:hypothetical protein n=1 Tax=unclassified Kitasatospora TaxID=2633591 RepID=UPI0036DA5EA3
MALWRGAPENAAGRHRIEWAVNEDILRDRNTRLAELAEPRIREEADRVVPRGRLQPRELHPVELDLLASRNLKALLAVHLNIDALIGLPKVPRAGRSTPSCRRERAAAAPDCGGPPPDGCGPWLVPSKITKRRRRSCPPPATPSTKRPLTWDFSRPTAFRHHCRDDRI